MGVKGDNLGLISGLLVPSFILNYMVIRVKEKELKKEKSEKEKRVNERTREGETKRKEKHWKSRFLINILRWR